jgi:hypothetical protein
MVKTCQSSSYRDKKPKLNSNICHLHKQVKFAIKINDSFRLEINPEQN